MKGNNNNKRKSAPRRRRNNNGSTVARNQTKYHRQYVGFETTFNLEPNTGIAMPIAPGNYNAPGSVPTTAYSRNFVDRFSQVWKGYRVLGWKCTMVVSIKENGTNAGMVSAVPFNQSLTVNSGYLALLARLKPTSVSQLCELPNIKMLTINAANSRNTASFSYFQGRRDINSLPFQDIVEDKSIQYLTGLQIYNESDPDEGPAVIRIFGNLLVEFKDPAFYIPVAIPEQHDDFEHVQAKNLKRLQRVDLTK